jgi:hypothetical protein
MEQQVIQWILTMAVMVALAWGGAKYAIGDHGRTLMNHQEAIEGLRKEMAILTPKATTEKIRDEIKQLVPFSVCREKQSGCRESNESSTNEILKKIDKLSEVINYQDQKRECGKDKFQEALTDMSRELADLAATIRERGKMFRKEEGGAGEPHSWI